MLCVLLTGSKAKHHQCVHESSAIKMRHYIAKQEVLKSRSRTDRANCGTEVFQIQFLSRGNLSLNSVDFYSTKPLLWKIERLPCILCGYVSPI